MSSPENPGDGLEAPRTNPAVRHRLSRLLDPPILFSGLTVLFLAVIWTATLNLTAREHEAANRRDAALTVDTANTYEAQVLRALRKSTTP